MREGARYLFTRGRSEGSREERQFLDEERQWRAEGESREVPGGNANSDYSSMDSNQRLKTRDLKTLLFLTAYT